MRFLDNEDVLWIDYRGKLYANGVFAPQVKSLLCDNIPERLVYVKTCRNFVLVLSENGQLGVVNTNTFKLIVSDVNVYWTNFIRNDNNVILELRKFGLALIAFEASSYPGLSSNANIFFL